MATNYTVNGSGLLNGITITQKSSPNFYKNAKPGKGIVVHHAASTSVNGCNAFANSTRQASAHYYVTTDGIQQWVSEQNGAWHAGCDWANYGCIGIETQNSTGSPDWKVSDKVFDRLARLMADIAIRHGWDRLEYGTNVWGHRDMTAHGAATTACPGSYLYPRLEELCALANGYMAKGSWVKGKSKGHTSDWWYRYADGTYPANKWVKIEGRWYHFGADGWADANKWVKDSVGWCWLYPNPHCYAAQSECLKIDGEWYAFDEDAHMMTSVKTDGGKIQL